MKMKKLAPSEFVLKTQCNTDKSGLEKKIDDADKKIPDTSWLVKKHYNAKITEIEAKIPRITGLATTSVLNTVENKIPIVSDLIKKTDYDAKISQTSRLNILLLLITTSLRVKYSIQR